MFPAGVGVSHGSGVTTPSGAFLYVYSDNTHQIRESVFPGWTEFLHDKTANTDISGTWWTGKPSVDRVAVGDRAGDELWWPACSIFWQDGTLWMVAQYKVAAPGSTPTLGNAGDPVANYVDLYTSPSGEGGDWTFHSVVQTGPTGWGSGAPAVGDLVVGPPLDIDGTWVMSITEWFGIGDMRPAIYRGAPGGLVKVHHETFGPGGGYANGASRMIGEAAGRLLWSCWSDSVPGPLGTRFVGAYSDDSGASWTHYDDLLDPDGDGDLYHRHCQLGSASDATYRNDGRLLQRSTSPTTGPWEPLWYLRVERGRGAVATIWRQVSPGAWLLFSHDKVWAMFGGWVVGAIGHS